MSVDVEVQTERDVATFLLVPDEGEGYAALEAKAPLAARAYLRITDPPEGAVSSALGGRSDG